MSEHRASLWTRAAAPQRHECDALPSSDEIRRLLAAAPKPSLPHGHAERLEKFREDWTYWDFVATPSAPIRSGRIRVRLAQNPPLEPA